MKIIAFIIYTDALESSQGLQTAEVCRDNEFKPTCKHGEVILIESALYGRVRIGACAQENAGLGCSSNVKDYLDSK